MVKYNPKDWFKLIFQYHTGDTLRTLTPALVGMGVYTLVFVWLNENVFHQTFLNTTSIHSLVGIVISLLLVFRTNSAYDRWWEGRKLWGALLNSSRNLSIQYAALLPEQATETRTVLRDLLAAFPSALRTHLRSNTGPGATIPIDLAEGITRRTLDCVHRGELEPGHLIVLMPLVNTLLDITGACERIRKTPIPYSYNIFIKKFVFTFSLTLPFALEVQFSYASIPITMFIFYTLASLELIAEEIEDPFGADTNDLPLDELVDKIRTNVHRLLPVEAAA